MLVASLASSALLLVGSVTPADASPAEKARRLAAATLDEVRGASAVRYARVRAETEPPAPAAVERLEHDTTLTIESGELGATAAFSGHDVASDVTVSLGAAPHEAAVSARSEKPGNGVPVSDPVLMTATNDSGSQVTRFPAKSTNRRGGDDKGPLVSDVTPGIALSLKPDMARVKSGGLDPATLQIYTREGPGEPWAALPSYFDAKSGTVRGESTHLSEFVVIGIPFPVPERPVIVLDPDNDEGHVSTPAPPVTELPYNLDLANRVAGLLQQDCHATVRITRGAENPVSRKTRAGQMRAWNPRLSLGIAFNTANGTAWGGGHPTQGGSQVYSRGGAADNAVSDSLVGNLPTYTGRPAKNMGNNGNFPGQEFDGVPGALTHLEALFLDNHYDRAYLDNGGMPHLADGVLTGLGKYLETEGFDCTDPVTGGWPTPPTAAELARWRLLGMQSYLTYGGEPFSFSTGNLVEQEKLFTLPGRNGSSTDLTLFYNSQDGRLSRVGAGWTFGLGTRAQRFIDGSVMVVRGDGASSVFAPDGNGGYRSEPGQHQALTELAGGRLQLKDVSGEVWVFDAGDIDGIGELTSHTDANGNTTTLTYGPADPDVNQFVPLTAIIDSSGQTIAVESDAKGRVTGFTRPGGDRWSLAYTATGDLATITLPDGRTHRFTYDGNHQLATATDATGALYLKNEYDGSGRVIKQWDAAGKLRTLDYSTAGQTTYVDTLGRTSVYFYDAQFRITKVQHPDGTTARFRFDDENNVLASTDENDHTTRYEYDASGNITSEIASSGSVVSYTYTPTGLLATRTDSGGPKGTSRTWAYEYTAAGQLAVTHQPDGTTLSNRYDADGRLVASMSPSGATTGYGYDAVGNVTSVVDPTGGTTRYAYDGAGRVVARTDPNGRTTAYAWDSGDRIVQVTDPAGGVTRYEWEPNDHVSAVVDATGAVSRYSWDALFHLTESTNPLGGMTKYSYTAEDALEGQTDPLGAHTEVLSDARDRPVTVVDPNGGSWKRTYDGVGNVTSTTSPVGEHTTFDYDAQGNLTAKRDAAGATTRFAYDAVGRLRSQVDPDGVRQSFDYDVMDRLVRVTDGLGKHTDYTYDVDGNLTSVTDRLGRITAYRYDSAGRIASITTPMGELTQFAYDRAGDLVSRTDPLGRTTRYSYAALGNMARETNPAGATTSYSYDAVGRVAAVTDANGHTQSYVRDGNGDLTRMTDATGAVTRYGFDKTGRQNSMTDANGHVTRYAFDAGGRLTGVTEGAVDGAKRGADVNVTTQYSYDADGHLTGTTDPNGHKTGYSIDRVGRVVSESNAVGNTSHLGYTAAGRVASVANGAGGTIGLQYDKRGDVVRQDLAGTVATYEYDAEQKLIAMTDPTGVSGWVYDDDGRVTTQIDQRGGRVSTSYDAAGKVAGLTMPTGEAISYTYDLAGRPTSQASPWGSLAYGWDPVGNLTAMTRSTGVNSTFAYDADDRISRITHGTPAPAGGGAGEPAASPVPYASQDATTCTSVGGYLAARSAPAAGQSQLCKHANSYLKDRTVPKAANPVEDGGSLSYAYERDPAGNVTEAKRTIAPAPSSAASTSSSAPAAHGLVVPKTTSVSYSYDALDRLSSSKTRSGELNSYSYDPSGNRVGWQRAGAKDGNFTQSAAFDDANRLVKTSTAGDGRGVASGDATYSYDGAGNRESQSIGGVATSFRHNAAGQTTDVARDGRATSYAYDGLGRRASTTDTTKYGTDTARTTFDGLTPLQTTDDAHGTSTLVRDAANRLAQHVSASGEATWELLDGLGSTVAGAVGASITELSTYDDWGAQSFESASWSAPENFTGETTDPTQALSHYYARSYDQAAGSWTTPDPWRGMLTEPQTLSRYGYAGNSPTTNQDLLGFKMIKPQRMPALPKLLPRSSITDPLFPSRQAPATPASPAKPKAAGPNSQNKVADRHDNPFQILRDALRSPLGQSLLAWTAWAAVILNALGTLAVLGCLGGGPACVVSAGVSSLLNKIAFALSVMATIGSCIASDWSNKCQAALIYLGGTSLSTWLLPPFLGNGISTVTGTLGNLAFG